MRIKVDEDLPASVAVALQQAGHDARSVRDEGMGGAQDTALWDIVESEGRVLITGDKGFADIRAHPPGTHPGVVLLPPGEDGIRPVMRLVRALLATCPLERIAGCVTVVTPGGIRVRRG